ncbi:hypothetical protein Tco_0897600 [Tanacetum coccineum]
MLEVVAERTRHKRQYERRVNKRQMQTQESKIDTGKALDADLVDTESIRTDSTVQDDNSRSGNDTYADDADIRPIYDEEPMAEVQLTAECNIFAIGQQHTEQPEIINEGRVDHSDSGKVLGKPVLQSLRNQSVVRQPNAFKSKRPQMSKQRFASQVDVNKNFVIPITQHYVPKKTKSAFAKPHHVIASSESRNSSRTMPRFSSNDMVHNHYLDEARKKTQERDRNSKTSVMPSARFQSTADGSKPKPRSNNRTSRSLPVSKSSRITITVLPKADHSKSSSSFLYSKKLCLFTVIGHRFSPNKTSVVSEKTSPRSDLRWKPTGRIFKSVGLSTSTMSEGTKSCFKCGTFVMSTRKISEYVSTEVHQAVATVTTSNELDVLFGPLFDEYFNGENQVVLKSSAVTTTDASNKRQQQPDSTSSTSTLATTVTANRNFNFVRSLRLSWKPCQGDSLNLPDHRSLVDGVAASFQRSRNLKPHVSYLSFQVNHSSVKLDDSLFPTIKEPQRCPGFLKSLVLFVLRSQELHNPQLHLGIPIS